MGCPKIVRCAACLLVSYRPLGAKTEEHEQPSTRWDSGPLVPNRQRWRINKLYKNNRLDYHAAGSYDVCRFNTRM